jgi:hypothetical protein
VCCDEEQNTNEFLITECKTLEDIRAVIVGNKHANEKENRSLLLVLFCIFAEIMEEKIQKD